MVYCCNYLVLLLLCQWEVTDSLIAVLLKIMHFAWYIQPPDIWQHQALHKVKKHNMDAFAFSHRVHFSVHLSSHHACTHMDTLSCNSLLSCSIVYSKPFVIASCNDDIIIPSPIFTM